VRYFAEWNRQLQVACSVEGSANGGSYRGFATGLLENGRSNDVSLSGASESERHFYTIYTFVDLIADDAEYKAGRPATTLNLTSDRFEALRCHLRGVTMAPVLFPRSNDVVVPADRFRDLYRQAHLE